MPRGGARPGAGRKRKTDVERAVTGNPGRRGVVLAGPGAGVVPLMAPMIGVDPPVDLTSEERPVWLALAPHAIAARTLTPATAVAFRVLCRNVALEQWLASSAVERGGANHRGLIQRVDAELAAFSLRPFGKPIYEAEPVAAPVNPLEKFLKRG